MKRSIRNWLITGAVILLLVVILSVFEIRCFGCLPQIHPDRVAYLQGSDLHICVNNFPDRALRNFIRNTYCADGSNVLTQKQLDSISEMDCSGIGSKSLKGIEHFIGLQKLNCANNQLETLDIRRLSKLTELDCSHNRLEDLNVTYNRQIETLNCSHNHLADLHIYKLNKLADIDCSHNELSYSRLFSEQGSSLKRLDCSYNGFDNLVLNRLEQLTDFTISPQNAKLHYSANYGVHSPTKGRGTINKLLSAVTSDGTNLYTMHEWYHLPKGVDDTVLWTIKVYVGSRVSEMQVYSTMVCSHQYKHWHPFDLGTCIHCGATVSYKSLNTWGKILYFGTPTSCILLIGAAIYLLRRKRKGKDWEEVKTFRIDDQDFHTQGNRR